MAWPPTLPPSTRSDATAMAANHASDHNLAAVALDDVVDDLAREYQTITSGFTLSGVAGTIDVGTYGHLVVCTLALSKTTAWAAGDTIITLPAPYRPAYTAWFAAVCAAQPPILFSVNTGGVLQLRGSTLPTVAATIYGTAAWRRAAPVPTL